MPAILASPSLEPPFLPVFFDRKAPAFRAVFFVAIAKTSLLLFISYSYKVSSHTFLTIMPQFSASRRDHRRALQEALAGRIVFQMDQTAPAHQAFFRHLRKCSKNANLDGGVRLCVGGDHQKRAGVGRLTLHFSTDSVRPFFRENRAFLRLSRRRLQKSIPANC